MTKDRDYDLIAACIGSARSDNYGKDERLKAIRDIQDRLMLELELDNRHFDGGKFLSRIDYWENAK